MNKYFAIIGNTGIVDNITLAETALDESWVDVTDVDPRPGIGWQFEEGTFIRPADPEPVKVFRSANEVPTAGGQALPGINNTYYAPVATEISVSADIVNDSGDIQTQLDQTALGYPPVLKMPVVKFAGGINGSIIDEVYFTVTLVEGVLTATGSLPTSGDWKLLTERLNASLSTIGADWKVDRPNTTFLV